VSPDGDMILVADLNASTVFMNRYDPNSQDYNFDTSEGIYSINGSVYYYNLSGDSIPIGGECTYCDIGGSIAMGDNFIVVSCTPPQQHKSSNETLPATGIKNYMLTYRFYVVCAFPTNELHEPYENQGYSVIDVSQGSSTAVVRSDDVNLIIAITQGLQTITTSIYWCNYNTSACANHFWPGEGSLLDVQIR
jgi:hypothetical protein